MTGYSGTEALELSMHAFLNVCHTAFLACIKHIARMNASMGCYRCCSTRSGRFMPRTTRSSGLREAWRAAAFYTTHGALPHSPSGPTKALSTKPKTPKAGIARFTRTPCSVGCRSLQSKVQDKQSVLHVPVGSRIMAWRCIASIAAEEPGRLDC